MLNVLKSASPQFLSNARTSIRMASSQSRAAGKTIAIVGGVAGGASAAARLRRNCEQVVINLYERGPYVSFANCGLPYYVGGIINDRSKLFLTNPKMLKERFNIDVHVNSEVVKVDPDAGEVTVRNTETGKERVDKFDEIVLSPGAKPIVPPFPGKDLPGIFTVRNVPDVDKIREWMDSRGGVKHATVIGGGFIGVEMAENLAHMKIPTTLVDVADQIMTPMDKEMVSWAESTMRKNGVDLVLGDGVASFEQSGSRLVVKTSSGKAIDTDMVIMSIGVRAESDLAKQAGLKLTQSGCIAVDENMRTSHPKVYAVGDAVEKTNTVLGIEMPFYMAGPANRQGRIVADVIAGMSHKFKGFIGTGIVGAFDLALAMTGASEKALVRAGKKRGQDFDCIYLHPNDHAGYYPGAVQIHMKVVFSLPDGKVLGAQAVAPGDGAARRIDVIATAMQYGGTVYDLAEAELCYAPQFGSAKDPVNMAGMYAMNVLEGYSNIVHWDDVPKRKDVFLLDCREDGEFANGAYPGAVSMPLSRIRGMMDQIPKDKEIWVYCQSGVRAHTTLRMLLQHGYNAKNVSGGWISHNAQAALN